MQRKLMLLSIDPGMIDLPIKFFLFLRGSLGDSNTHIPRPYPNQSVAWSTDIIIHYPGVPVAQKGHSRHV